MTITPERVYQLGEVGNALSQMSEKEQAVYKAHVHCSISFRSFSKDGIDVVITDPVLENDCVKISIEASQNGNPLFVDNPVYFYNPPIMIPDGTVYQSTDQLGNQIYLSNYKEDIEQAFQLMVIRLIKQMNNL